MQKFSIVLAALLVAGCFTVSETKFPTFAFRTNPSVATNVAVAVNGFAAIVTDYTMVDGYQTVFYSDGPYRYYGGPAIAHTTTVVPQQRQTDAYLEHARNRLEELGFNVMAQTPDYTLDTRFSGPYTTAGETAASIAWLVCSLLTCDHSAATWSAKLKIHDNRTGRLVFSRDYSQKYEVTGFSPIPLFGISYYDRTTSKHIQNWCLSALTEQVVADAAQFLTSGK